MVQHNADLEKTLTRVGVLEDYMRYQFGPFEVDSDAGRLFKHGVPLLLREQPFQLLVTLLSSPGEVISRETLRSRLWGKSTFVDFENGLNSSISRLRVTLDDIATKPIWIETVPKRGYRFIGLAPNPDAVAAYLKGHYVISPHTIESMRKALGYFTEAIRLDPCYPLPYHGAALVFILGSMLDDLCPSDALPQAEEYLVRGLECPQKSAMVYNTLAMLRTFQRRWTEAEDASDAALDLEPNNPYAVMIRAQLSYCCGDADDSIARASKAVALDPTNSRTHMHLVKALYYARRFEECVLAGDAGLDVCPDAYIGLYTAFALLEMGKSQEAMSRVRRVHRPGSPLAVESAMRAFIAARAGNTDQAHLVLEDLQRRRKIGYVPAIAISWLEMALGYFETSIDWMLRAIEEGEPFLSTAMVSPAYGPLHNHCRWADVEQRLNLSVKVPGTA